MNNEFIDPDHPVVQEVQQIVTSHGWMMTPGEAVEFVREVKNWLARQTTRVAPYPPPPPVQSSSQPTGAGQSGVLSAPPGTGESLPPTEIDRNRTLRLVEQIVRDLLPDRIHNMDGATEEIPDDLYEEIAAVFADHHQA
jgi:hypothetical protein